MVAYLRANIFLKTEEIDTFTRKRYVLCFHVLRNYIMMTLFLKDNEFCLDVFFFLDQSALLPLKKI